MPVDAGVEPEMAIEFSHVSKVYRLYGSLQAQVMESLGLAGLRALFGRRTKPREFTALRDINLVIRKGERVGLIGRNGAGKTTLLKLVTGNFQPTLGAVEVNGTVQALMQIGLGFHPEFSGYENIRSSLHYNGLSGEEFNRALADVIDFVELGEFLHQPMKTYSLGMNTRVQFAAATAIHPDILIVDEILGAGDAYFAGKSAHRMQALTSSGCTLLLVSHSTQQVLQFCERAIWLDQGQVRMDGAALDVVKRYEEYIEHLSHASKAPTAAAEPSATNGAQQDYITPGWQQDRLAGLLAGEGDQAAAMDRISRWPSEYGLKVDRVQILDGLGQPSARIRQGEALSVDIEIVAEHAGAFEFKVAILVMTLEGVRVTRHLSPPFKVRLQQGEGCRIRLRYPETWLANGDFVFSVALFKQYDPENVDTAIRYDLLSRSFKLCIQPKHASEPAIFHHPGEWMMLQAT